MEPYSIAAACGTLTGIVASLIYKVTHFALQVRSARKDMDAVARELMSLKLSLSALEDDEEAKRMTYSMDMKEEVKRILVHVEIIAQQMNDLLSKLSSVRLGRKIQWAFKEEEEMNKLRSSLESNRGALEVALTLGTISILTHQRRKISEQGKDIALIVQTTNNIAVMTTTIDEKINKLTGIQADTTKFQAIAGEIAQLRTQLTDVSRTNTTFAEQSQAFATALIEPLKQMLIQDISTDRKVDQGSQETILKCLSPTPIDRKLITGAEHQDSNSLTKVDKLYTVTQQVLDQKTAEARKDAEVELQRERELVKQLRAEVENLKDRYGGLAKYLHWCREENEQLRKIHDQANTEYKMELAELYSDGVTVLNKMKEEHKEELTTKNQELSELRLSYANDHMKLVSNHNNEIKHLKSIHDREVHKLREKRLVDEKLVAEQQEKLASAEQELTKTKDRYAKMRELLV